uniref:NADAR domain-containing protein n=2 Tax=Strongyloides stercoralis TaxID=6248 RepID=A0A0K0EEZ4_STRER
MITSFFGNTPNFEENKIKKTEGNDNLGATPMEVSKFINKKTSYLNLFKRRRNLLPHKKGIVKRKYFRGEKFNLKEILLYNNDWDEENDVNLMKTTSIPRGIETLKYTIDSEKIILVEDSSSIYSLVHRVKNLNYDGINFHSVDEAYQYYKLIDFCGSNENMLYSMLSKKNAQRSYVKMCLALHNKTRADVIKWRGKEGLKLLFNLTYQKFVQNKELYEIMKADKDKLILNIFGEDNYDACGRVQDLVPWLHEHHFHPIEIPEVMDFSDIKLFPKISTGRNLQGVIVMLVRRYLEKNIPH